MKVRSSGTFSSYQVVNSNVAIARSLVSEAPVILADEPTGNLDPKTAGDIIELLKSLAEKTGKCVIVVTTVKKWHKRQILHLN